MQSFEDVEKWVAAHNEDGNGVDHLQKTLAIGLISGRSAGIARAWLDERENGGRRRHEAEQLELARRSTAAAETSAAAATEAAKHAAASAKWAKVAALVAVLALLVSARPFLTDARRAPAPVPAATIR